MKWRRVARCVWIVSFAQSPVDQTERGREDGWPLREEEDVIMGSRVLPRGGVQVGG